MGRKHGRNNNWNDIVYGSRSRNGHGDSCGGDCGGSGYGNDNDNGFVQGVSNGGGDETFVSPTETIVNTRNNYRTVKRVHPTHIRNVNRNITRVENYYPVTESVENENYVEEYDCGREVGNSSCCRPRKKRCPW